MNSMLEVDTMVTLCRQLQHVVTVKWCRYCLTKKPTSTPEAKDIVMPCKRQQLKVTVE